MIQDDKDRELLNNIGQYAHHIISALEEYEDKNAERLNKLDTIRISCDGAGFDFVDSAICVCVEGQKPMIRKFSENYTNNQMEYVAMICALIEAVKSGKRAIIFCDSQLVVNQLSGAYQVNDDKMIMLHFIATRLKDICNPQITWVHREQNEAGINLEKYMESNRGLQEK